MSDALLGVVQVRIAQHLHGLMGPEATREALDAITANVATALVLARREGMLAGLHHAGLIVQGQGPAIRNAFPLPTRTRQVLREEPAPGSISPLYRVRDGVAELLVTWSAVSGWVPLGDLSGQRFGTMRHLLDLHANPYRTEDVPGDEGDPWGEGAVLHPIGLPFTEAANEAEVIACEKCPMRCANSRIAEALGWKRVDTPPAWRCLDHLPAPL